MISAGILLYRRRKGLEVYLAHMGGPFWESKEVGAWSIPKGLVEAGEDLLQAARREFSEETGYSPAEPFVSLGSVRMKNGKEIHVWAAEALADLEIRFQSNTFQMEWPKGSGEMRAFQEMDKAEWCSTENVKSKLVPSQVEFIERLMDLTKPLGISTS